MFGCTEGKTDVKSTIKSRWEKQGFHFVIWCWCRSFIPNLKNWACTNFDVRSKILYPNLSSLLLLCLQCRIQSLSNIDWEKCALVNQVCVEWKLLPLKMMLLFISCHLSLAGKGCLQYNSRWLWMSGALLGFSLDGCPIFLDEWFGVN